MYSEKGNLKQKIVSGVFWQGLEKFGSQVISFGISIILARLLAPEEFGVIALLTVFIALADVFIDSGFRAALVQKKELKDTDCDSVFWLNLFLGGLLYVVLFFCAPLVAGYYEKPVLSPILRTMALIPFIRAFTMVHNALLFRKMLFQFRFRITWSSLGGSSVIGVVMAYCGFGVWSLVAQQLSGTLISTAVTLWLIRWSPRLRVDLNGLGKMFLYSMNILSVSVIDTLFNNIYRLMIGKLFDMQWLGLYNMGNGIPKFSMSAINGTISSVMFPAFSKIQDEPEKIRAVTRRANQTIMFFVLPVMTWLMIVADPLVRALLTDKWLSCVVFLQIGCLQYLFWPLHVVNLQVITAVGKSQVFLILEVIKKILFVLMIVFTYRYGVVVMAWGLVAISAVSLFINCWPNRKIIGYGPLKQLLDLWQVAVVTVVAGGLCFASGYLVHNEWGTLTVQSAVFGAAFLAINLLFRPEIFIRLVADALNYKTFFQRDPKHVS